MKPLFSKAFPIAFIPLSLIIMSATTFGLILFNQGQFGNLGLEARAAVVGLGLFSLFFGFAKFKYSKHSISPFLIGTFSSLVCLFFIYFFLFSIRDDLGFSVEEISNQLITDSSSNGYVEVGFGYPIYTPRLRIKNDDLYTRNVEIFFRVVDQSGEVYLYRAVRENLPDSSLSVESAVRVMLSESLDFLFNPISIAPFNEIEGKVAFIISNADNGADVMQQFSESQSSVIEFRDEVSQELIQKLTVKIE